MGILTKDQVKHIAHLANFKLPPRQILKFQKELSSTLEFVQVLEKVKTKGVEPTSQVSGLKNITREDRVSPSLPPEEALRNAGDSHNNFFKTKAVFSST